MSQSVAVFDIDLPPGVAFVRSLGGAGVPIRVLSADRRAAGRWSRYVDEVQPCPPVRHTDDFVSFLTDGLNAGTIDLVAPTSDHVAFAVAAAADKLGIDAATVGHPAPEAARTALFKDRFYAAVNRLGLPTPPWATPVTLDEATAAATEIGYPVVLKPRTHAGIGLRRGVLVADPDTMARTFRPWPLRGGHESVLQCGADVALPLVQRYFELGTVDVISVCGYLAREGSVAALGHCRKVASRGPRRGVIARHAWGRAVAPMVGAMHEWRDPLPGVRFVLDHLRHPRAFVRPFLIDSEMRGRDRRPQVLEDPGHGTYDP